MRKIFCTVLAFAMLFFYAGDNVRAFTNASDEKNGMLAGFYYEFTLSGDDAQVTALTDYSGQDTNYIGVNLTAFYNTEKGVSSKSENVYDERGALDARATVDAGIYRFISASSTHKIIVGTSSATSTLSIVIN